MLLSMFRSGASVQEILIQLILVIPVILISLTFHEVAHGYISYKLGDPTAYNLGRLSLNPAKHLDPIGSLCMLLFGVGWAKPVPVNARRFKNPRRDMAITGAAGPISNLLLHCEDAREDVLQNICRLVMASQTKRNEGTPPVLLVD